jgi:hypothetical protein
LQADKVRTDKAQSKRRRFRGVLFAGLVAAIALGLFLWRWTARHFRGELKPRIASSPTYVGEAACAGCHAKEAEDWSHSHHALAMQRSDDKTVLGNFNNAQFTKDSVTSSFYKKDDKYYVRTDGPDGQLQNYELLYTFGYFPLQQYLVPFPGGRLQSLGIAWDSRTKDQGGQRWFHLISRPEINAYRSNSLDRTKSDLELHVRRLPLDQSA